MARAARRVESVEATGVEYLPPETVSSDVYDVEVDELTHPEIELLNSEVQKQKQLPREEADFDAKVLSVESKIASEDAWNKKVSEVEGKVDVVRPPSDKRQTRRDEVRKLDEAQLKLFESQRDEARRLEASRNEPRKNEAGRNDTRRVEDKRPEAKKTDDKRT